MDDSIVCEKREHSIWIEGGHRVIGHPIVGQWQYIYSSKKGKISLVQIYGYPIILDQSYEDSWKHYQWEIMAQEENLFEDVERYNSKEEAEARIQVLLGK